MQVGDAALALEHAGALQLVGRRAEVLEQPDAVAQQHGDQVDLELVEQAGSAGARWVMLEPCTMTFLSPAACFASRTAASRSLT